jgi:uroporphyrinogen decarboxylase
MSSSSRNENVWEPLPREEVIKALRRERPSRIPMVMARWWGEGFVETHGDSLRHFDRYPEDATIIWVPVLTHASLMVERMGLSWEVCRDGAHDASCWLDDWSKLDEFIAKLPDAKTDPDFPNLVAQANELRRQDRYTLFGWWYLLFEKPWSIRGMTSLLMDYHLEPDNVHRLHDALCAMYCGYIERAARELQPDGFWASDDLGHQTQLFMSPSTFRQLIKPYYVRVGKALEDHQIDWWLHSCGNNSAIMDDLIEVGVDVFHPVQKGTMDEVTIAREFGDRLTFLVGIDVQHTLQEKDSKGVRDEVRFLIDTFDRPGGGLCIAAGNGIVPGTPLENVDAFLDEAVRYGTEHRARYD